MADSKAITKRADDFSAWYTDLIMKAELADYSPVRGCMVIRPNGYAIWEQMKRALYDMFKATGHQNAYFPLFIPQSFLSKEAEHVEGFAPELAVVTHGGGKELEEPLVVRPTSETIIYSMFSKWIQSHRDLPLLINQWANAVRWEMRTRLFLRTTEFLWQEGHTAHATEAEAEVEMLMILGLYRRFMEEWMAMPVVTGRKTDSERFAGALRTYSCEALMQDNKALQAGTSHNLGQNFAKAFDVTYQTAEGGLDHVWNTSWGVSTRLIGGLIMTHGDDNGMICPPRLAQWQVVIVPIWKTDDEKNTIFAAVDTLSKDLQAAGIRVTADRREGMKPGAKYYEWEARGVPFRLEMGPRDIAAGTVMLARRTGGGKEAVPLEGLGARLQDEIVAMQKALLDAAIARREAASLRGPKSKQEFIDFIEKNGGFVYAGWCGDPAVEAEIKEQTKATIRCLPDAEFRSAGGPDHLYLDWTSCHGRGCVGASVLTPVEADAGLSRDLSGELLMSGVPLAAIADAVGTPAWCYNAPVIRERFAALEAAFDGLPHRIDYAVKANSNLAILRLLAKLGAGADIVSGGELLRALAAGFKPAHIVFSGVGKTDEELVAAMTCGVGQINVESISELHRLAVLSDAREGSVNIGIRLNPDVTVETHPYISTGKGGLKFGIPIDQLDEALAIFEEAPGLRLSGLAVHIGSQLLDPAPYVAAIDRLQRELDRVRAAGHRPTVLDLGGGLGIMYREETPLDPVSWMAPLREAMIRSECEIHIEPGRYLVGSAGVLLTRVVHRKYAGGREMVIVDAAMNDLIRPALYKAWHEIVAVEGGATAPVSTDIVGPVCETGDFFALDRPLPLVQPGAHLAILGAGAYGFTMSSNYNSRARAAEVLVEDGKWAVVRPRERLTDLFKDEVPDPFAAESRDPS